MNNENMLLSDNLTVGYGKKIVVDGLSFEIKRGQILTIIGANGAGKSTVLKTIIAQIPIIKGKISLCGRNLKDMGKKDIAKDMSVLLTEKITAERMTCGDVVATGRYPYTNIFGVLDEKDKEIVKSSMEMTSSYELYEKDFGCISDGQRQCVMLARAIAQEPNVMLLDEPTSFLDISHKMQILSMLRKLARKKETAVIQSLHELDMAQKYSDMILCIKDGKADKIGTPEEIFKGDYIEKLYGIKDGSYNTMYAAAEAEKIVGNVKVFVIGGGGSTIPIYRKLQREGIVFAAGVIHKNDVEYPIANALAMEIIEEEAFESISEKNIERAVKIIEKCDKVICAIEKFGTMNDGNRILYERAKETGKLS
ncbi:MAG: ABC transporter ATP-binding protein [Firmicutes bacterium]|nr:ABC transporter ATP-binding protein [Bacillota bacterium]